MAALRATATGLASALVLALPIASAADGPAGYQVDPVHSGAAQGTTFAPPLGRKWVRRDLGEGPSFPVLAEGRVFLTAGSMVYALDRATGATVWSRSMRATGVAYDAGRVFAVDSTGVMQALSAASGNVLWSTRLPGASSFISPPTAFGDFVYASSSSTVFGVRQDTGIVVWSRGASTDERSIPAVDRDKVYTSRGCAQASALERTTGVEVWDHGASSSCSSGFAVPPAVHGDNVFAGGVVLDSLTGLLRDTYTASAGPAFAGGAGFFVNGRELYARDDASGVVRWRYMHEDAFTTAPIVAGDFVYVVDDEGKLIALARPSGQKLSENELKTGFSSSSTAWAGLGAAGDNLVVSAGSRVIGLGSGPDAPGIDDPDKPEPQGDTVELGADRTKITFGRTVTVSGRVDNASTGQEVEIQADPWPFDGYQRLTVLKTDSGSFTLRVKPDRNTRYRAVYNGTFPAAQSSELTVFSDFALAFRIYARGRRRVLVRMTAAGPRDAKLRGARLIVYHYRARARTALRVGSVKLRGKRTRVKGQATMRTPTLRRSDLFFACRRETADDGFGEPEPRLADCGKKRVR